MAARNLSVSLILAATLGANVDCDWNGAESECAAQKRPSGSSYLWFNSRRQRVLAWFEEFRLTQLQGMLMRPTNILRDQSSILQFVIDKEKKDMN